jgi:Ca-activated chloride channel homolog
MPFRALRFLEPGAAYWLLMLPIVWACWLLHRWSRDRWRRASGIGAQLGRLAPITAAKRDIAVVTLATVGTAGLVAAAARPQALVSIPQYESIDLIVLLDHSASMLANDIQPSRLGRACLEIQNLLRDKPEAIDRVALIAFANTALVTSHLTHDLDILFFFLDWIKQDANPYYGTDIATGLGSVLTVARAEAPGRRKAVVLVSDGEGHGARLDQVLGEIRRSTIPVYVVGIGGDGAATIPAPPGSDYPRLRDDAGRELTTRFSEVTLRRIATTTGGSYFRSTSGLELAATLADVAARGRRASQVREEYRDVDALALGAAALVLSGLLVLL